MRTAKLDIMASVLIAPISPYHFYKRCSELTQIIADRVKDGNFHRKQQGGADMSASVASLRISAECDQCKTPLIAPEWSEIIGTNETVHIWRCSVCGHEFKTIENKTIRTMPDDEVIEDSFPNLLVAWRQKQRRAHQIGGSALAGDSAHDIDSLSQTLDRLPAVRRAVDCA